MHTRPGCGGSRRNTTSPSWQHRVASKKRSWSSPTTVACVLTSMEQGRTFVSYVPRWKVPSGDANYRFIKACCKQFLHYYWYWCDEKSRSYREEVSNPSEPSCG